MKSDVQMVDDLLINLGLCISTTQDSVAVPKSTWRAPEHFKTHATCMH
jgi:hypothetical protein